MELVGFIANTAPDGSAQFGGLPVAAALSELGDVDAVLVTDLKAPQAAFDGLRAVMSEERILTPRLLRVIRGRKQENGT